MINSFNFDTTTTTSSVGAVTGAESLQNLKKYTLDSWNPPSEDIKTRQLLDSARNTTSVSRWKKFLTRVLDRYELTRAAHWYNHVLGNIIDSACEGDDVLDMWLSYISVIIKMGRYDAAERRFNFLGGHGGLGFKKARYYVKFADFQAKYQDSKDAARNTIQKGIRREAQPLSDLYSSANCDSRSVDVDAAHAHRESTHGNNSMYNYSHSKISIGKADRSQLNQEVVFGKAELGGASADARLNEPTQFEKAFQALGPPRRVLISQVLSDSEDDPGKGENEHENKNPNIKQSLNFTPYRKDSKPKNPITPYTDPPLSTSVPAKFPSSKKKQQLPPTTPKVRHRDGTKQTARDHDYPLRKTPERERRARQLAESATKKIQSTNTPKPPKHAQTRPRYRLTPGKRRLPNAATSAHAPQNSKKGRPNNLVTPTPRSTKKERPINLVTPTPKRSHQKVTSSKRSGADVMASGKTHKRSSKHVGFAESTRTPKKPNVIGTYEVCGVKYSVEKEIGKGASCTVYKVMDDATKEVYALKRVRLPRRKSNPEPFRNEIRLLQKLKDIPEIITLVNCEEEPSSTRFSLVFELGDHDFASYLRGHKNIDAYQIKHYWKQMLRAVLVVHEQRIVHGDLKPQNFLLVKDNIKLIDFGIAKQIRSEATTHIQNNNITGTLNYMAPECVALNTDAKGQDVHKVSRASDIFSLGCILYEMTYGHSPFGRMSGSGTGAFARKIRAIEEAKIQFAEINVADVSSRQLLGILERCLKREPKDRPTADELLNHSFLNDSELRMKELENHSLLRSLAQKDQTIQNRGQRVKDLSNRVAQQKIEIVGLKETVVYLKEEVVCLKTRLGENS